MRHLDVTIPTASYYAILGLTPTAPATAVEKRYRELAKILRPATRLSDTLIQLVDDAHRVLADPQRRAEYDRRLSEQAPPSNPPSVAGASGPGRMTEDEKLDLVLQAVDDGLELAFRYTARDGKVTQRQGWPNLYREGTPLAHEGSDLMAWIQHGSTVIFQLKRMSHLRIVE